MRNGEARRARNKTQDTLSIEVIHFINDTINVVRQARTTQADLFVIAQQVSSALCHDMLTHVHRQAQARHPVKHVTVFV